jgi:hypothetical protein
MMSSGRFFWGRHHLLARQVIGQGPAGWLLRFGRAFQDRHRFRCGGGQPLT